MSAQADPLQGVRVLVVEDSPSVFAVVRATLEAQGYQLAGRAESGSEAVALAESERPDLVLMDISLVGEMDGIQAAGAIREGVGSAVVFLTSHTDPEALDRARAVEPHGYLLKPLDPRALRPTLEMALHKHRMEGERQQLTERLQAALAEVEQLQGLLPVCAWCRRVRDDAGYWENLEGYVAKRLRTTYSHGICPDCMEKVEGQV